MRIKWKLNDMYFVNNGRKSEFAKVEISGVGWLLGGRRSSIVMLFIFQEKEGWVWEISAANWISHGTINRKNSIPQTKTNAKKEAEKSLVEIGLELEWITLNEIELRKKEQMKKIKLSIEDLKMINKRTSQKSASRKTAAKMCA
jgi:hypothetical protein